METTVKERLMLFIKSKHMSIKSFEATCNVSHGYVKSIRKSIGAEKLMQIISVFPELNRDWLLYGEGEMLLQEGENSPKEGIPLIPLNAMAGALSGELSVQEYECERYSIPAFYGADFLIPVKGSSMLPTYSSGDIVACKRVNMDNLFFQWGKVYIIDTDQGALIKRIKPGKDETHLSIVSDNSEYEPFQLPISSIYAVALVIGLIRLE